MSDMPQRFPAPVSDQAMYLAHSFHNAQGHLIIRLAGCLDLPRLARAVRLTLDAEPVLGCRFVPHPFHPYWQRRDDLDSLELCPVYAADGDDGALWRFIASQPDCGRDPLVRVGVFRSLKDTLCLKLDHMLADAAGVFDYARLLAAVYTSLGRDPSYAPEPNLGSRSFTQVLRTAAVPELLSALPRPAPGFRWNLRPEDSGRARPAYAIAHVEACELPALSVYCRSRGAAMSDAILAAYYRALFAVLKPSPGVRVRIGLTVNMRRALPDRRAAAVCNLSSIVYPAIRHRPGVPFGETLADVRAATSALRSRLAGLETLAYLKLLFASGFALPCYIIRRWGQSVPGTNGFGLANIGIVRPEQVDFREVGTEDLCPVGPVTYPPGLVVTTSTYCGRMTISAGYSHHGEGVHWVQRLVEALRGELLALAHDGN